MRNPITLTPDEVHNPQHLRSFASAVEGGVARNQVLDIYTGVLVHKFVSSGDLDRVQIVSWVPLGRDVLDDGKVGVQGYPERAKAIVTASLTSFGGSGSDCPYAAGVDRAFIETKKQPNTSLPVLVLSVCVAAARGALHRVSYQVTVLADPAAESGPDVSQLVERIDTESPVKNFTALDCPG